MNMPRLKDLLLVVVVLAVLAQFAYAMRDRYEQEQDNFEVMRQQVSDSEKRTRTIIRHYRLQYLKTHRAPLA